MKTATAAALIVWFLSCFLANSALVAYGFLPMKLVAIGLIWGFFELLLGSIVGSKLYRDAQSLECNPWVLLSAGEPFAPELSAR